MHLFVSQCELSELYLIFILLVLLVLRYACMHTNFEKFTHTYIHTFSFRCLWSDI